MYEFTFLPRKKQHQSPLFLRLLSLPIKRGIRKTNFFQPLALANNLCYAIKVVCYYYIKRGHHYEKRVQIFCSYFITDSDG